MRFVRVLADAFSIAILRKHVKWLPRTWCAHADTQSITVVVTHKSIQMRTHISSVANVRLTSMTDSYTQDAPSFKVLVLGPPFCGKVAAMSHIY